MGDLIKNNKLLRIQQAKVSNTRERNIAKQYFNSGPSIGNLARAAYHWWNSVPGLGGENESGNIVIGGEAPTPGMKNPKSIVNGINRLIPRYNAFAKYYGYKEVPAGISIEKAEQIIKEGLNLHNTFYRGLTIPDKITTKIIKQKLGNNASDIDVMNYLAKNGSRNPKNTYLSPDNRSANYAKQGDIAIIKRKYNLSDNPETWIDDADFIYDTTPATSLAPRGSVNYPWAGKFIEKAPPGEVRINPEDYTFEGWLPKSTWEYGTYVKDSEFKGSKNLYFNEKAGHHKPKFKQGGQIVKDFKLKFQFGGPVMLGVVAKKIKPKVGKFLRNRMFKTVPPTGYYISRIGDFILNNNNRFIEDLNTEALYGKYLGQDSVIGSVYNFWKKGINPPGRKVSNKELNPLYKDLVDNNYDNGFRKAAIKDLIKPSTVEKGAFELVYPEVSFIPAKVNKKKLLHNHSIGTYTIKPLKNNKGTKYSDSYDINPFRGESAKESDFFSLGQKLGLDRYENLVPFGLPYKIRGKVNR